MDVPILTCIFFTFNWLTLTSEMHFVKFHPELASYLLSRGKRRYAPPGDEAIMKIHKKLFSGIPFNFTLFVISPKLRSPSRRTSPWGPKARNEPRTDALVVLVCGLSESTSRWTKTTKNLILKFWICNQKNMGFHLILKIYYFRLRSGRWECDRQKGL